MKPSPENFWVKATTLTVIMPLLGFLILGFWWHATFSWEKNYVPPFYWTALFIFASTMIFSTPIPLLWTIIAHIRKRNNHHRSG